MGGKKGCEHHGAIFNSGGKRKRGKNPSYNKQRQHAEEKRKKPACRQAVVFSHHELERRAEKVVNRRLIVFELVSNKRVLFAGVVLLDRELFVLRQVMNVIDVRGLVIQAFKAVGDRLRGRKKEDIDEPDAQGNENQYAYCQS
jgi:hypothetical protein